MSDQNKLAILAFINSNSTVGAATRLSFNSLSKTLGVSKEVLDGLLVQLNKDRFISQYAKKGVDSFTVILNEKAIDALNDESFI